MSGLKVGTKSNIKEFIQKYKKLLHQDNLIKNSLDVDDQVDLVDEVNDKRKNDREIESQIEHMLKKLNLKNKMC